MTRQEIKERYPNASESFIRANLSPDNSRATTKLESNPCHEPLAKEEVQGRDSSRVLVRVTSIRTRLIDEDNLCEKYHIDLLRYAKVIAGDSAAEIKIETGQRKAQKGEVERIVIEVFSQPDSKSPSPSPSPMVSQAEPVSPEF